MPFTWPYVTDTFIAYLDPEGSRETSLSLAVWLKDEFTGERPFGQIVVAAGVSEIKPIRNISGYYLFCDLVPGLFTVRVKADIYLPQERAVVTYLLDPKNPVIELALKPKPSYPYPGTATLVRGLVTNGTPVSSAEVSAVGKPWQTVTDESGEFALYLKGIKKEDLLIEIRKGGNAKLVNASIEEGKTTSVGLIQFP